MSDQPPKLVSSPCVSSCYLDENDICEGCYRTAEEITDWTELSENKKREVIKNTRLRFKEKNKHLLL